MTRTEELSVTKRAELEEGGKPTHKLVEPYPRILLTLTDAKLAGRLKISEVSELLAPLAPDMSSDQGGPYGLRRIPDTVNLLSSWGQRNQNQPHQATVSLGSLGCSGFRNSTIKNFDLSGYRTSTQKNRPTKKGHGISKGKGDRVPVTLLGWEFHVLPLLLGNHRPRKCSQ